VSETLHIRTTEPGLCATCGRELADVAERLTVQLTIDGRFYDVAFCQACLEEHAPHCLDEIRSAAS
jgi:hypothetical protein